MNAVLGVRAQHVGWIGVDLDGTLAMAVHNVNEEIGEPVPVMLRRVLGWIDAGWEVRIVTARVSSNLPEHFRKRQHVMIQEWLMKHYIPPMLVTSEKDFGMCELWDDRAVHVEHDTGIRL